MADFKIVLGNKNYSSWSLRGWLALKRCGVPFDEEVIPLYQDDWRARLLAVCPAGKVPMLLHGDRTIWDTLAIVEYLAEVFPAAGLWPEDRDARALARALSAEMHAGFAALREDMPMNFRGDIQASRRDEPVEADIARIVEMWQDRARGLVPADRSCLAPSRRRTPSTRPSPRASRPTMWTCRRPPPPIATPSSPGPMWRNGARRPSPKPG